MSYHDGWKVLKKQVLIALFQSWAQALVCLGINKVWKTLGDGRETTHLPTIIKVFLQAHAAFFYADMPVTSHHPHMLFWGSAQQGKQFRQGKSLMLKVL